MLILNNNWYENKSNTSISFWYNENIIIIIASKRYHTFYIQNKYAKYYTELTIIQWHFKNLYILIRTNML